MILSKSSSKQPFLKGKWIVNYREGFNRTSVLEALLGLQEWIDINQKNVGISTVLFDSSLTENRFFQKGEHLYINIKNLSITDLKPGDQPSRESFGVVLEQPIHEIIHFFPVSLSDRRWQTMGLPAASLFLSAILEKEGFRFKKESLEFPAQKPETFFFSPGQLVAITMFEELFVDIKSFLEKLRRKFTGLVAAGGPFVTLAPLPAIYHLPEVNLFVRGEVELILPDLLRDINRGNINALLEYKGLLFQTNGSIVVSDLDVINRPKSLESLTFGLNFIGIEELEKGLELNLSRGCRRGCVFCSKVQGREIRQLPVDNVDQLLRNFQKKLKGSNITWQTAATVNLNDDDILQDLDYSRNIFKLVKSRGFTLWGVQAAFHTFFNSRWNIREEVVDLLDDEALFVEGKKMVWIGTDTFLALRGKRLAKPVPPVRAIGRLVQVFEERKIMNVHYWICSDFDSTWQEFVEEFLLIVNWHQENKYFKILAHSPFLVPYPSTPLYRLLVRQGRAGQIFVKSWLQSKNKSFNYPLVDRVVPRFENLDRMLQNERGGQGKGFLDYLNVKDFFGAMTVVYHFLKQERLMSESFGREEEIREFKKLEERLSSEISAMQTGGPR